jgi:hypothetical protein
VTGLAVRGRARRDGGAIRIPVTAAAAVDPTDGDVWRAMTTRLWSPVTRLRAAILVQALADLRAPPDTKVGAEVRTWFASEDLGDPWAFVPLCETLGLDPDAIRSRVLEHRQVVGRADSHRAARSRAVGGPTPSRPSAARTSAPCGHGQKADSLEEAPCSQGVASGYGRDPGHSLRSRVAAWRPNTRCLV